MPSNSAFTIASAMPMMTSAIAIATAAEIYPQKPVIMLPPLPQLIALPPRYVAWLPISTARIGVEMSGMPSPGPRAIASIR